MAVVESSGQLESVERPWSASGVGVTPVPAGMRLYGEHFAAYDTIYATQPAVRTVIGFLARNIAQLGIHVFRRISDTDRERLTPDEHGLPRTLEAPNPWTTRFRSIRALVHDLKIYDEAHWLKFRSQAGDIALVRIPPARIAPVGDNWLRPDAWLITGNRNRITVPAEDVVSFRGYNPLDDRRGLSSMETLRRVIAEEAAAGEYRENMWRNGARMEHVITRPKDAPVMSPDAKTRFWERWNAQYVGSVNSARTALLEEGMDIKPMSFSGRDSQYVEARKFNLEEIARFFHVPLPMIGILDNANYSNMAEAHKQLYQDTVGPDLEEIQEEIELQLAPEFPDSAGLYVEFNIAEKLKGSFEEQARAMQTAVGGPIMTRNEGRARVNLPRIDQPEADELITPMNVVIGGLASPTDTAATNNADDAAGITLKLVQEA